MVKQIRIFIVLVLGLNEGGCKKEVNNSSPYSFELTQKICNEEIMELTLIIAGECSNCDSIEMRDVGSVVLNRVDSDLFPETIKKVIMQYNQFHGYMANQYAYVPECWIIAQSLIMGVERNTELLYFWRNNQKKPKYVKEILIRRKYHDFGK